MTGRKSLWWIPTLYFAEGVPYFIVNNISIVLFAQMGVSNGAMSFFTSWLYLPWVIKPLWSPIVDIFGTKRRWIIVMQAVIAAVLVLLTLTLPHPTIMGNADLSVAQEVPVSIFTVTLILFIIAAFASATHDIAADGFYMLSLDKHDQAEYVGLRSVFYRLSNIFCNSLLVFIAGWLESNGRDVPTAWQITIAVAAVTFCILTICHSRVLPESEHSTVSTDSPKEDLTVSRQLTKVFSDFGNIFITFFKKPFIIGALVFMLLFRLPEAFLLKLAAPFMLATNGEGIGISLEQLSLVNGIVGVVSMLIGGILGGMYAAKFGLKRSMWLMALAITLPDAAYLLLSIYPTQSLLIISMAVAVEQFGYGFGFTAYMLYLMHFSEGDNQTSHYALCTGFMAMGMMIPGFFAGYIQESVGYMMFFVIVMICCCVTLGVTHMVRKRL